MKRVLAVLLLLALASPSFADDFGYTTIGGTEDLSAFGNPRGSKFTASADGTVTTISVRIATYFGGTCNLRAAIYNVSAGRPGSLRAYSSASTSITASNAWYTVTIDTGTATIANATEYFLIAWSDPACADMVYDASAAQGTFKVDETFPTWPDPWNESGSLDRQYSIYATYVPSGGGGGGAPSNFLLLGVGPQ